MKKNRFILILSAMLLAGSMFSSCLKDRDVEKTDPDTDGEGCLILNIGIDGILGTRADESTGIAEESRIDGLWLILYSSEGKALYIDYYSVTEENGNIVVTAAKPSSGIEHTNKGHMTYSEQDKKFVTTYEGLKKQVYKLLVIANPTSNYANLGLIYNYSWGYNVMQEAEEVGHDISLFTDAWDLSYSYWGGLEEWYAAGDGYAYYYNYSGVCALIGIGEINHAYPDQRIEAQVQDNLHILMMNGDGITEIGPDDMKPTLDGANASPITINIERAVAKVAVFDNLPTTLNHQAILGNGGTVNWVTDILNFKTYLFRQKAPKAGGGQELFSTSRKYRYATDPNFTGVSIERPGSGSTADSVQHNFFNVKNHLALALDGFPAEDEMFYRTANPSHEDYNDPDHGWTYWDYVTENTMAADEQYEDVTTRVLVRLTYVPHEDQIVRLPSGSGEAITDGKSYYSYKNKLIFTVSDMNAIAADAGNIDTKLDEIIAVATDDEIKSLLKEMKVVLGDPTTRAAFSDFPANLSTKVTFNNLNHHLNGLNYYYVLVRHFDNYIESVPMAYGRYGVVRNNVYKIVLQDINGPGYGFIPDPKGPDDKENLLSTRIQVMPWTGKALNYEL